MKYETKKRIKLSITIAGIFGVFFMIVLFLHNPFFVLYFKAKQDVIPDLYRNSIYTIISEIDDIETGDVKTQVRKKLWTLVSSSAMSNPSEPDKPNKEINSEIQDISDYVLVGYAIIAFIVMITTASLVTWYKSNNSNIIIKDNPNIEK